MADFGATVIKVEPPRGDAYRGLVQNPGMPVVDHDFHWQAANRNKLGLALDLRSGAGRASLDRLIESADVLVTNFPLPTRRKLRLQYTDVVKLNERLIYASLSAYGEAGPEADNTGFDSTAYWARSGLMHMIRPDPEGGPARSAPGQGDHPSGISLFGAIMLGLYQRQRTGRGCHVHTSLLANGVWGNAFNAQAILCGGTAPMRPRREQMGNALTNHYRTADDRWFILTILNQERDWPRLLRATGAEHLAEDQRYVCQATRNRHGPALCAELDAIFSRRDLEYWKEVLNDAGLTIGVVGTNDDVAQDAQMRACGALRPVDDASGFGAGLVVDSPMWVEGAAKVPMVPAPTVGQHGKEILPRYGFSADEIEALESQGAF